MGFRNWITKNASKTAESVIIQTKETLQKSVEAKVTDKGNALFTLGKLALLGLIFLLTAKEVSDERETPAPPQPTSITINNYIERREQHD